ncbi:rod shape-determining protein MreD [Oceanirhabdus sp. W0125-5]|uniref:rod shape-determining protein MreD n=1 Tax=Oceanirhabdus sp. W0125-5 TaxID=2999116 RepID=UPI0022F30425|nr:rod shape-determining protein MreD [Oceanirhabdus sp. W0125-5]WBW95865.1 rod shape-determining protein MreD [Oceanirhabdus sp. W0125-5]
MKKYVMLFFISILLLVVDNTLMPFISIRGVYPSMLFIFFISYSFYADINEVIFIGCVSGLLQDIFFIDVIGVNALINLLLCLSVAYVGKNFIKSKILVPIIMVLCASLIKGILLIGVLKIYGINLFLRDVIYISIYNFFIAAILEKIIFKFYNLELIKSNWRF